MNKKEKLQNTLNRILRLKEKATLQQRWEDVHDLRAIQNNILKKLNNERN